MPIPVNEAIGVTWDSLRLVGNGTRQGHFRMAPMPTAVGPTVATLGPSFSGALTLVWRDRPRNDDGGSSMNTGDGLTDVEVGPG